MPEIIDGLVKSGKEIEAVYFASESGLTERFPPVSLLKTHLRNCRKNANNISKNGKFKANAVVRLPNFTFLFLAFVLCSGFILIPRDCLGMLKTGSGLVSHFYLVLIKTNSMLV